MYESPYLHGARTCDVTFDMFIYLLKRNVMREMKHEGGVWTSKNTIKDGLLHQFQYTKLFVKDSSLLLAIQTGGATRQWGRKNSLC